MLFEPEDGAETPKKPFVPQKLLDDLKQMSAAAENCEYEIHCEGLLAEADKPKPCLVEPFFQQSGLACIAGSSDTGKSALLRQLALDIAGGADRWLGFDIHPRTRNVVYVATEDGRDATRNMARMQSEGFYLPGVLKRLRFMFDWEGELLTVLERNLSARPADLVIIDCFSDAYGDDLKDTTKIRDFLEPYRRMSERLGCLILFLHHTGKRTESLVPNKNNLLSGQGFESKMRLVMELRADHIHPRERHLCIVKGNYLPQDHKRESHILHFDEATLRFTATGGRMAHEVLGRGYEAEEGRAKFEQARDLKKEGHTYEQIAEMMGYANKSSISDLFRKARRNGWDTTGDEEEPAAAA